MGYPSQQIRSTITSEGQLRLSIEADELTDPGPEEVIVRIEASPINPSDLGLLLGPADPQALRSEGSASQPLLVADISAQLLPALGARLDKPMSVGNEGAGVVVATGESEQARALAGKTVAVLGGGMYARYRKLHAGACLVLPEGTTAAQGASCFVNPLTALGMVETMRLEGHAALVHTAAASNLGQMLNKVCLADEVPLVNIVRREAQEQLLRELGARWVVNSSKDSFKEDLVAALDATNATLAFDATGGGKLAGQILSAMEVSQSKKAQGYSRYGSTVHKQVYIYGGLDRSPTILNRTFGMAWGVGGWLLTPFLQKAGAQKLQALRQRVASEIKTTFASGYTREVSLAEALQLEAVAVYAKQATGEKFLINPNKDV